MTFRNSIRKLIRAEGYKLRDYEGDAKTMDGNLNVLHTLSETNPDCLISNLDRNEQPAAFVPVSIDRQEASAILKKCDEFPVRFRIFRSNCFQPFLNSVKSMEYRSALRFVQPFHIL